MNLKLIVKSPSPLLAFLFTALPDSNKTRVRKLLKHGCVSIAGRVTTQFDHALRAGDEVVVNNTEIQARIRAEEGELQVLYEDKDLIAISKASGLLSIATDSSEGETAISSVNDFVNKKKGAKSGRSSYKKSVYIVHRLDRDVSGVMLFAKNEKTKQALQENWCDFTKEYVTVVEGCPSKKSDTIVSYLAENKILKVISGPERPGARRAETYYEVIQPGKKYSLLSIRLGSGRKHQIRVHLADIGCPVAGDKTYGAETNPIKRVALHACRFKLTHPATGKPLQIDCPAPDTFRQLVK